MIKNLLNVENLSVRFGDEQVVKNINFHINQGEVFALVGESGSGKSVSALSILRLLPEDAVIESGNVYFAEQNIFAFSEKHMRNIRGLGISMIFQEPMTSLNPVHTVEQQILEVLKLHTKLSKQAAKNRVIELLELVELRPQLVSQYPHQLSGGMKQRVMIAMALACNPKLLIADEPTTALDVTVQMQILSLLKNLQEKQNLAILLITHDLSVVAKMADRVAVMRNGEILEQATAAEFFKAPKHKYSQNLLNAVLTKRKHVESDPNSAALLEVKNLKVYFPIHKGLFRRVVDNIKAVDDISLEIEAGKTLAIVGESGSGKTTIAHAIVKLLNSTDGKIIFEGKDRNKELRRRDIQIIFQDPYASLNPRMRIGDIIEEGMQALKVGNNKIERHQQINELLKKVGLSYEMKARFPHEFSGGQRQRIAIARALAVKPKLIICDEPTSALDVSVRSQILDLLTQLQRDEGLTYLVITHDMSVVGNFADRVAVMYQGKIVEHGTVTEVFDNPKEKYTQTLLSSVLTMPS
jgi:peptide/nickel transport system ATP-binding protein